MVLRKELSNKRVLKDVILLIVFVIMTWLPVSASLLRRFLYILSGCVFMWRIRTEDVTIIEGISLVILVYLIISLIFPVIMPFKKIIFSILEIGGIYGILHFLTGELIAYIFFPKKDV